MSFDDEPTRMSPRAPQPPAGQPTPPAGQPRVPHPPAGVRQPVAGSVPPGQVPPGVDPAVAWAQDPRLTAIEDRLSSLRTALWAFAAVSIVALGLAFWALLDQGDSDGDTTRTSSSGTSALRDRVQKLEDRLEDRATDGDVEKVSSQVSALSKRVDALPTTAPAPQDDGGDDVNPEAVTELQGDVEELQQQVQALEQAAAAAGGDTGEGTTTP
jgi:polyhydroxyalkanoate synthesis regulator phasin